MSTKKYKCPYCEERLERKALIKHVDKVHKELIPEGFSAERVVYNSVNKTSGGRCRVCGRQTEWNASAGRYNVLCNNPRCKQKMREDYKKNMLRVRGTYNILNDPQQQEKMLANRKISGKYTFQDGGIVTYTGTYEKKCLEFMDIVMNINSSDIMSPGPTMEYEYNGEKHIYIPDFYYIPYNLIIEVKDGGNNPNNKHSIGMNSSREKTLEKERIITDKGEYNYIRLTDNQFTQLLEIFMTIKEKLLTGDVSKTYRIHESSIIDIRSDKTFEDVKEFNNELNKWDYGIIVNNKTIKDPTPQQFSKYRTCTIEEMNYYHIGVCWDYVNYESAYFTEHNIPHKCIYIYLDSTKCCTTHTFIIFNMNNNIYWFESAWWHYQGIRKYRNEHEAIADIFKKQCEECKDNIISYFICEYKAKNLDQHLTAQQYTSTVTSKGKNISDQYITPELKKKIEYNQILYILGSLNKREYFMFRGDAPLSKYKDSPYVVFREIIFINDDLSKGAFVECYKYPEADDAVEIVICAMKDARGTGVTDKLIKDAIDNVPKKIKYFVWRVDKSNKHSIRLAERNGFIFARHIDNNVLEYLYTRK